MIAIIEGCGYNLASISNAVRRLGYEPVLTSDPEVVNQASRVILPGVGHASGAMRRLRRSGLVETLQRIQKPLLGICLGMQLLYEGTEEAEDVPCLGLLSGWVKSMQPVAKKPLPHMGWNQLYWLHGATSSQYVEYGAFVYYVHSYAAPITEQTLAWSAYGHDFTAIVQSHQVVGMQFHPEKSSVIGERLLACFLAMGTI